MTGPITPAVWERMPWHPKARAIAAMEARFQEVMRDAAIARAYATEHKHRHEDLERLALQIGQRRLTIEHLDRTIADRHAELARIQHAIDLAEAQRSINAGTTDRVEEQRRGKHRLVEAHREADRNRLGLVS